MTAALVTGAGGFVGSHIVEELLRETDWHVTAVDSFRHNGSCDRLAAAIEGQRRRVRVMVHDLTAPFAPSELASLHAVTAVADVASLSQVDESITDPAAFVRNNIDATLSVLELARAAGCRTVHLSTDEVYGPAQPASFTDHRPSSPYAASKAAQEDLCYAYRRTYGLDVVVVNSVNMFGERQSQLAFIPRIIRAVRDGNVVPIHTHEGRPGFRNYLYVKNTASMIVHLLTGDYEPPPDSHRIHLPGQRILSNQELALEVGHLIDRPLRTELVDAGTVRPGYDPGYGSFPGPLGWQPPISFDVGLSRTVAWAMNNPHCLEG